MTGDRPVAAAVPTDGPSAGPAPSEAAYGPIHEQYLALQGMRYTATACGLGTVVVGLLGLVGDLTSNWVLASFVAGYKIMVPSVALSLAACGLAILCLTIPRRTPWRLITVLAIIPLFLGGVRLLSSSLGMDWNSSNLFLRPPLMPLRPDNTPAAFPTALSLFLAAGTLLLMRRRVPPVVMFSLAGIVTVIGAAFVLGYAYHRPLLYGPRLVPVALPAAIGLTLVGIGITLVLTAGEMAVRRLMSIRRDEDRTELVRLRDEAERNAAELRGVLDAIPDGVAVYNASGTIVIHNNAFARLTGLRDEELHLPLSERLAVQRGTDAEGRPLPPEAFPPSRALRGETMTGEQIVLTDHVLLASGAPLVRDGQIAGAVTVLTDISELHRAREQSRVAAAEMEAQRNLLQTIISQAPVGLMLFAGTDLRVRWANESYRSFLDEPYRSGDITGMYPESFAPGSEAVGTINIIRTVAESGKPIWTPEFEYSGFGRGTTYWRAGYVPVPVPGQVPDDVLLVAFEITEQVLARKRVEALSEEAQRRADELSAIINAVADGIVVYNADGSFRQANEAALAIGIFGPSDVNLPLPERVGKVVILDEEGDPVPLDQLTSTRALRGETVNFQVTHVQQPDGAWKWLVTSAAPLRNEEGEITGAVSSFRDITTLREAQEELRQNERRLRVATSAARLGVFDWQLASDTPHWDGRMYEIFGRDPGRGPVNAAELFADFLLPEDRQEFERGLSEAMQRGGVFHAEARIRRENDEAERWIQYYAQFELAPDNTPLQLVGVIADITEQRRTQEQLAAALAAARESQAVIQAAMASMSDAMFVTDIHGNFLHVSQGFRSFNRFASGEEDFRKLSEYPDYLEAWSADGTPSPPDSWPVVRALRGESGAGVELRIRRRDTGQTWWGSYSFAPTRDPNGEIVGAVVVARDITEQKQAEEALRKSEERFQALVKASSEVIYRMSADWTEMRSLSGGDFLPGTDTPSQSWLESYIPPEDQAEVRNAIDEAIRARSVFDLEHRVRRVDGSIGWTLSRAVPILDESGAITEWFGMASDITARKQAEETLERYRQSLEELVHERTVELETQRNVLQAILNTSPAATLFADGETLTVKWNNSAYTRLLDERFFDKDLAGLSLTDFVPEADASGILDAFRRAAGGETVEFEEFVYHGFERGITYFNWVAVPVPRSDGRGNDVLNIATEVTDQVLARRELEANQQRLRALAAELTIAEQRERQRLAAALHDEVAQTLSAIKMQMSMIRSVVTAPPTAADGLVQIIALVDEAIRQSRTIMTELSPPVLQRQGLIEALRWWGEQVKEKHGLEVAVEVEGSMERLAQDVEATVFQAIKELLQNTIKYAKATQVQIRVRCSEGGLDIEVADDGVGFDPTATQVTEKGGFGLFSVRERIAYLGGDFQIDSTPGKGTREHIGLPLPCVVSTP